MNKLTSRAALDRFAGLSKKDRFRQWVGNYPALQWRCLHCGQTLAFSGEGFVCPNGHTFDMAKQGYVYLARTSGTDLYSRSLFALRRQVICHSPFFQPLHRQLVAWVNAMAPGAILDAGCGEGSHLYQVYQSLVGFEPNVDRTWVGVDLAKEGIQLATDYNGIMGVAVADLSSLPFQDGQFDLILSMLSPANYQEFKRVAKKGGQLIKGIPNPDYLGELRTGLRQLGLGSGQPYSNQDVLTAFHKHFPQADQLRLCEQISLTPVQKATLIQMTPLTWHLKAEESQTLLDCLPDAITLDMTLLRAEFK